MKRREFLGKASIGSAAVATLAATGRVRTALNHLNVHAVIPNEVQVKAGGTVNFIISGFHQIIVYGERHTSRRYRHERYGAGHDPARAAAGERCEQPLLQGRGSECASVVTGAAARTGQPVLQDRVEAVQFAELGRYLVICGVLPHFLGGMYGYVKVNP
jgi:plastocyanin